jgi:diguanylate cyclase
VDPDAAAAPPAAERRLADRRLRRLVGGVVAAGVAVTAVAGGFAFSAPLPDRLQVLVAVGFVLLGCIPLLHLRWGHNRESFNCAETGLVFGLALLPLPWLVVVAGLGTVLVQVLTGYAPLKALYNASNVAIGVAGLGIVLHLLVDPTDAGSAVLPALLVLLAGLAYSLWTGLAVSAAIATAQDLPTGEVFADGLRVRLLVALGNTLLGLGVLALAELSRQALAVVPPFLALLYVAYRAYLAASEERDTWRRLEESTRAVTSLDAPRVVAAALAQAVELFRADRAEIVLDDDPVPSRHLLVASERERERAQQSGEDPTEVSTWAATRLETARQSYGTLRIGLDGAVSLSRRERAVLTAFGHTVSAALENARLFEGLRVQAARSNHAARHDALTGLPNRVQVQERASEAFVDEPGATALLLVDLDHFKEINDTLGHNVGDRLLSLAGKRLAEAVGPNDLVARLGGDEFAVLLPGLPNAALADEVAGALLRVLSEPMVSDGVRLAVEGSIGIACHPQDGQTFEDLLQRADVALYQAKSSRGSWRRYDPATDDSSVQRLALVAELGSALARDELLVHFQPQVDLRTGEIVALETLARWEHPTRGLLNPGEFVPAAEHSGLVRAFTLAVLDKAVEECALWRAHGREVQVAVNLSARSLLDCDLPHDIAGVLRRHDLPGSSLVVELTETTVMSELEVIEDVLARLRQLDIRLSVDDFGTGYSSLAFLRRVAVHEVKIDQSFVTGMIGSHDDAAIVGATIQLADSLGLRVVAEGVESEDLRRALLELGCTVAQGFYLHEPLTAEQARQRLGLLGPDGSLRPKLRLA